MENQYPQKLKTFGLFRFGPLYSQGAQRPFNLPKKYPEAKTCIFWCKTTQGTMVTKGILPLVGEPH